VGVITDGKSHPALLDDDQLLEIVSAGKGLHTRFQLVPNHDYIGAPDGPPPAPRARAFLRDVLPVVDFDDSTQISVE
jgi:hypothetical protein